jgi:hypothetical protein
MAARFLTMRPFGFEVGCRVHRQRGGARHHWFLPTRERSFPIGTAINRNLATNAGSCHH